MARQAPALKPKGAGSYDEPLVYSGPNDHPLEGFLLTFSRDLFPLLVVVCHFPRPIKLCDLQVALRSDLGKRVRFQKKRERVRAVGAALYTYIGCKHLKAFTKLAHAGLKEHYLLRRPYF